MPVTITDTVAGPFTPNGVTVAFPFTFKAVSASEVIVVDEAGTALSSALYSVALNAGEGGTVTFSVAPLLADYAAIYVVGDPALTQPSDFDNAGPSYNPAALTRAFDRAAIRDLKIQAELDRALMVPFGEAGHAIPSRASLIGKFLVGDAGGDLVPSTGTGADAGLRTDLAAVTGGALIGLPTRSLSSKLGDMPHFFDEIPGAKHAGILAGSNTDDVDGYIQTLLDLALPVVMPKSGRVWIGSTLNVPSYGGLVGNFGCEIKALADFGNNPLIRNSTTNPASLALRDKAIRLWGVKLDGNKANNTTATEFSHGVHFNGVDGITLNIWADNTKGDGVLFNSATGTYSIGCRDANGWVRTENAFRQGVAMVGIEAFDLSIFAYKAGYLGFDVELDQTTHYIRNGFVRLTAIECGQNGSGTRGAASVIGTNFDSSGVGDVRNIVIDVTALNCLGTFGVGWRDCQDITFRGDIKGQTGNGAQGFDSGFGPSRVHLDLDVTAPTAAGLVARNTGEIISGRVHVTSPGTYGISLENCGGGTIEARIKSAGQEGILLNNTDNMTFPDADITLSSQAGVSLTNTSSGNRFPGLKSTGSVNSWGYLEAAGCSDNRATDARLSSNSSGTASVTPTNSIVTLEQLFGKATYDAPSIAAAGTTTTTVTVTGAAFGDRVSVEFGVSLAGLVKSQGVSAADTDLVALHNPTAGAIDIASTTIKATNTPEIRA